MKKSDIYVNESVARLENVEQLVLTLTGHEVIPMEGGSHDDHCSVAYYDCEDMLGYTMVYDVEPAGNGLVKVTGFDIIRDDRFDHEFDLNRKRLREVLEGMQDKGVNRDVLLEIGAKFGVLI